MGWGFWLLLAIDAVIGIGIFAGRNWLKASIERSVQHRFDARLEELRADLRKSEEGLKSELRLKEGQITALRDGVLSGRAQRQALLDKRRLEAVDRLWAAFMALAPFAGVSKFMSVFDFDVVAQDAPLNSNMRKLYYTIAGDHDDKMNDRRRFRPRQGFRFERAQRYSDAIRLGDKPHDGHREPRDRDRFGICVPHRSSRGCFGANAEIAEQTRRPRCEPEQSLCQCDLWHERDDCEPIKSSQVRAVSASLPADRRRGNAGDARVRAASVPVGFGKPIPTILITAYPDDAVRERGLSAGPIGYLSKPLRRMICSLHPLGSDARP
jgi:hypothetical protein